MIKGCLHFGKICNRIVVMDNFVCNEVYRVANYYIDYENVHNEGLNGIELLDQGDKVTLFYSDKADTLKIDVVQLLMGSSARIEFVKIVNGVENALDFQLITALMCNYDP